VTVRIFGCGIAHAASNVHVTYAAKVWDLSIVQGPFSVTRCQTWFVTSLITTLITRSFNGNTVRNFPTHGQLSAAQGNLTSCLNFDFAILNLFEPSAL
jgi:hypothetical protein